MDLITIFGLALALAMDAFAVALGTALALPSLTGRHLFRLGWHFGLFQALMPIVGWLAGLTIQRWIVAIDHWIAFGLLVFVGGRMITEALRHDGEEIRDDPTRGWSLVMLSVATSIDALAVGLTLAMLGISIWFPALIIGLVAGILTVGGMLLGRRVGDRWGSRVEVLGGLILIVIGLKILVSHL
ncbi:putative Mn2+ efflux pump MntP [Geothermobacter ehrlichii]|uniref:Putative manganese efflux pump MntP n=1 Tax=Geothermobacter ehrlichii TaxID=213224 RepID=A0A5D3WQI8_9BACT|nr:manganese efflux pump MntP family protein [Geothermobacter ehrlichii]TYO99848.1 putative Mn2+ efflux pump MntP [Geothermobacter ehrlichii]